MIGGLVLLRPAWLLALLPVAALAWWVRRRRLAGAWGAVIDPALLPALRRLGLLSDGSRNPAALLPFVAAGWLALALAGPAVQRSGAIEYRALDPLILILDLSPSVVAETGPLGDLQAAAAEILGRAGGRPVGIMAYAADAYLVSAPTSDAASLQGLIAVLDHQTMPVVGSRPDIALSMARSLFDAEGNALGGADLVLISDGGGAGPRATEEAARLGRDGARIWALTLPRGASGAPAPDAAGLSELARAGSGADYPAGEVAALMERIDAARTARLARDPQAGAHFLDLGPWLLPLAMLAMLPLFRRRR